MSESRNGPLGVRFWRQVDKRGADECWEWQGCTRGGYGLIGHGGAVGPGKPGCQESAHRVSLRLHGFIIPPGALVCHHCDNRPCVNPNHLYVGTPVTNMADMYARGGRGLAERSAKWKLTWEQYREIARRHAEGEQQKVLAAEFGVHPNTVSGYLQAHGAELLAVAS